MGGSPWAPIRVGMGTGWGLAGHIRGGDFGLLNGCGLGPLDPHLAGALSQSSRGSGDTGLGGRALGGPSEEWVAWVRVLAYPPGPYREDWLLINLTPRSE